MSNRLRLHYFRTTVEAGSIRTASRRLSIAASAVSRQLGLLEAELGGNILERSQSGVKPTELGLMLLSHCHRVDSLEKSFKRELENYHRLEVGQVNLCVGEGFVSDLVSRPMKQFSELYKGIAIELDTGSTNEIIRCLMQDQAHIGVMYQGSANSELHYWYSSDQPLLALMAPNNTLANKSSAVSFRILAQQPLIMWRQGHGVRHLVDEGFKLAGYKPNVAFETNSLPAIRHMVMHGMGITLLPACAMAQEIQGELIFARPVDSPVFFQAQAHVVTRVGRSLPRAGLQLLRHLGQWINSYKT